MDNNNHLLDILILINNLQKNATCGERNNTCTNPILGNNTNLVFDTRPISFYLCNNNALTISYSAGETNIFRIENIKDSCITVRLLISDEDNNITATNEFATINIDCIAAIKCLNDISLNI